MNAPNLHVALALAVGLPPSSSDAQLIDAVYALRREGREPAQRFEVVPLPLPWLEDAS